MQHPQLFMAVSYTHLDVYKRQSYGVFIDLGGVDGLIHITDLSWGRVSDPKEVVELDQKLNVVILDFDDEKKRIALGLKQLTPHPWDALDANLQVGDEVEAVILTLDRDERKMSLGIKQLKQYPWETIEEKYPVGSKHTAKVRNFTNFGVFVEIEEGVDGLIHISDLSWTKKVKHPSEFTQIGADIEVQVLEIDKENRRLSLGHKQLEENPWDVFCLLYTSHRNDSRSGIYHRQLAHEERHRAKNDTEYDKYHRHDKTGQSKRLSLIHI